MRGSVVELHVGWFSGSIPASVDYAFFYNQLVDLSDFGISGSGQTTVTSTFELLSPGTLTQLPFNRRLNKRAKVLLLPGFESEPLGWVVHQVCSTTPQEFIEYRPTFSRTYYVFKPP